MLLIQCYVLMVTYTCQAWNMLWVVRVTCMSTLIKSSSSINLVYILQTILNANLSGKFSKTLTSTTSKTLWFCDWTVGTRTKRSHLEHSCDTQQAWKHLKCACPVKPTCVTSLIRHLKWAQCDGDKLHELYLSQWAAFDDNNGCPVLSCICTKWSLHYSTVLLPQCLYYQALIFGTWISQPE